MITLELISLIFLATKFRNRQDEYASQLFKLPPFLATPESYFNGHQADKMFVYQIMLHHVITENHDLTSNSVVRDTIKFLFYFGQFENEMQSKIK